MILITLLYNHSAVSRFWIAPVINLFIVFNASESFMESREHKQQLTRDITLFLC